MKTAKKGKAKPAARAKAKVKHAAPKRAAAKAKAPKAKAAAPASKAHLSKLELTKPKNKAITLRISDELLSSAKKKAKTLGVKYQRFIRMSLEKALHGA